MSNPYMTTTRPIPMSDIPEEYRDIAEELGLPVFLRLTALCGGQNLYIPKLESLERSGRDREIRARFDGGNYRALAAQFRLSEALVVLCWFEPVLAVGITLGCFLANVFSTVTALDMVVGTLATALACLWTIKCRKTWFIPMPNVLVNAVIVGGMLAFVLFPDNLLLGFATAFVQVGFGELAVMYVLGLPLLLFAKRTGFMNKLLKK